MESEPEEGGLSHTGPLSRGLFSSRKSVGRCHTMRPQRVPVSSIHDDNPSGDEEGRSDTATPSNSSDTLGTVMAIINASRRLERQPSGDPPPSAAADSCPDKENAAGRRLAHPCDLLTPLPRRAGPVSAAAAAGRAPRQPLGRLDTPARTDAEPPAGAGKRPFGAAGPGSEKRPPPLQHASRSYSALPSAERPAGLSRGLSEGLLRRSLPVVTEGTPPEQRVSQQLDQSGSAPAAGPTSRVSPAPAGSAAGTPRPPGPPPASGLSQDARPSSAAQYQPAREGAGRQVALQGGISGTSQLGIGTTQASRASHQTPYRSAAPQQPGGPQQPARSAAEHRGGVVPQASSALRRDAVDGPGSVRAAPRQEVAGSVAQQPPARSSASGAAGTLIGPTATPAREAVSSQPSQAGVSSCGVTGSRPPGLYTSASVSAGHSRLGLSTAGTVLVSSAAVVSTSSLRISSSAQSVSNYASSTLCSAPSVPTSAPVQSSAPSAPRSVPSVPGSASSVASSAATVRSSAPSVHSSAPSLSGSAPPVSNSAAVPSAAPPRVPAAPAPSLPTAPAPSLPTAPAPSLPTAPAPSAPTAPTPSLPAAPAPSVPAPSGSSVPPRTADGPAPRPDGPATAAMPPPPAELVFGKRQLRTLTVNKRDYLLVKQIGRGGSSKVYQVLDSDLRMLAIKQVFLENTDEATASGYRNEIALLRSLQHSERVVRLIDCEHRADLERLYIVMELGNTDLTGVLRSYTKLNEVDANMCKFFWTEMLRCVDAIHKANIVHSDLKPSNFLMVAGRLKLIDFGIASQIQSDCTSIIKDSQVGTFNYMSPEAIEAQQVTRNGASQTAIKISRRSDVWSLGCILYNFVYGITPFGHIKQTMGKLMAIVNPRHEIEFPPVSDCHLLAVLRACLRRDPYQRPSIEQLLTDPYLTGCRCQCMQ